MRHCLVIELDGGQHNFDDHQARDRARDIRLTSNGLRVLRFWNNEVDRNLDGVLQMIDIELRKGAPHPAAFGGHPPPLGEG
jgi:very-short-patch-repair endonuclease